MQSFQPHTQRGGLLVVNRARPFKQISLKTSFVPSRHKRRRVCDLVTQLEASFGSKAVSGVTCFPRTRCLLIQAASLDQADVEADHATAEWQEEYLAEEPREPRSGPVHKLPAEMRYFDTASILVKGGDGGKGCVAFRREKYVPKGGPAGGNGGSGGNVWVEADAQLNSLNSFKKRVHYRADNGTPGGGSNMTGADAGDLVVKVPPGTVLRAKGATAEELPVAELVHAGDRALLMAGGRGGRGNASFKSARNKAPAIADLGEEGKECWLDLELKLVADVGIIGVPNAGKSTLLSVITAAKPKVADYPFTTLVPNLGVCEMNYRTTVFADIPGLLEGAHTGRGLGHEFLRHCQRARILVHVIDGSSPDPIEDFKAIQMELELFAEDLAVKPQVVAYNKMDLPDSSDYWTDIQSSLEALGVPANKLCPISAATGQGVIDLIRLIHTALDDLPAEVEQAPSVVNQTELPKRRSEARIDDFSIELDMDDHGKRMFVVTGEAIERFSQMTNWDYYEAANRFQKVLEAAGINKALKKHGVAEGNTVLIGDAELAWSDNQSEAALYEAWLADRKAKNRVAQGVARWPHQGG